VGHLPGRERKKGGPTHPGGKRKKKDQPSALCPRRESIYSSPNWIEIKKKGASSLLTGKGERKGKAAQHLVIAIGGEGKKKMRGPPPTFQRFEKKRHKLERGKTHPPIHRKKRGVRF